MRSGQCSAYFASSSACKPGLPIVRFSLYVRTQRTQFIVCRSSYRSATRSVSTEGSTCRKARHTSETLRSRPRADQRNRAGSYWPDSAVGIRGDRAAERCQIKQAATPRLTDAIACVASTGLTRATAAAMACSQPGLLMEPVMAHQLRALGRTLHTGAVDAPAAAVAVAAA